MQVSQGRMRERRSVEREFEHFVSRTTACMKQAETQRSRQAFPIGIDRDSECSGTCHDSALLLTDHRFTTIDQILQRVRTGESALIDPRLSIFSRFEDFFGLLRRGAFIQLLA